jgi:hypothetical protein
MLTDVDGRKEISAAVAPANGLGQQIWVAVHRLARRSAIVFGQQSSREPVRSLPLHQTSISILHWYEARTATMRGGGVAA